jgi:hypothetical protein
MLTQWQSKWEDETRIKLSTNDTTGSPYDVYQHLRNLSSYKQPKSFNGWLFFYQPITPTVAVPYTVHLPDNYDPHTPTPLLVVLHGSVRAIPDLPPFADSSIAGFYHRHFTKYAARAGMIVVYPFANRSFNWMTSDSGFSVTPSIIRYLKEFLNIDDDAVYCTGHSNGATGSFSYLLKAPGLFAGFSGMNTQPVIRTGGTFLANARNRSFYNIATDKDYYFPPAANDSITRIARSMGITWTTALYNGYPHWFPQFDTADGPVSHMFDTMLSKLRNPFHPTLNWETDDITNGRCDWIAITALDTTAPPAPWHRNDNFKIPYWIANNNPDSIIDSSSMAFHFPRRSGAIEATSEHNVVSIRTSRVRSLRIYLSPQFINPSQPITVLLDGRQVFHAIVPIDKPFMIRNFQQEFDRKAIWTAYIDVRK